MLGMALHSGRWHPCSQEIADLSALFAVGRLTKCAGPIARNHTFIFDFDFTPLPPDCYTNRTFEEICLNIANSIWNTLQGKTLCFWWSGGIDSTAALVALMRTNPRWSQQMKIRTTRYALDVEYPWFYQQYLVESDHTVHRGWDLWSEDLYASDDQVRVECSVGGQLFAGIKKIDVEPTAPWRALFDSSYFKTQVGAGLMKVTDSYITEQVKQFPVPIQTVQDVLWAMTFLHKWDWGHGRPITWTGKADLWGRSRCFYNNWDWQRWSMSNPQYRNFDHPKNFKQVAKDFIFDFTGDADYRDNKSKILSVSATLKHDGYKDALESQTNELILITTTGHEYRNHETDYLYLRNQLSQPSELCGVI